MAFKASVNDLVLPRNPSNLRVLRLSHFFGQGIDEVADVIRRTLAQIIDQEMLRAASLTSIVGNLRRFLAFCVSYKQVRGIEIFRLSDMDQQFADRWAHHCLHLTSEQTGHPLSVSSRRHIYAVPRILFTYAKSFGIAAQVPFTTERVLFPRSKQGVTKAKPYSSKEFGSIISALKHDLTAIEHSKRFHRSSYHLALKALLVAIRTGLNSTPLLELTRDCLLPHPVDPARFILSATKHRANRLVSVSIATTSTSTSSEAPSDAVRVIKDTLADTATLAAEASGQLSNQLWLFSSRGTDRGTTTRLTQNLMHLHMMRFAKTNSLLDDRGRPLLVNLRRMRKTFVNRIYEKSGGDLFVTAQIANNTPRVSDLHYLAVPDDGERAFAIAGNRVVELLSSSSKPKRGASYTKTAVAGCQDPLFGERAPGDGNSYCEKFIHCFSCKHMVVAGNDLHRLYSFYWFLAGRLASLRSTPMYSYFKSIIRLIDEDIALRFDPRSTELAKSKARNKPHPIWRKADLL